MVLKKYPFSKCVVFFHKYTVGLVSAFAGRESFPILRQAFLFLCREDGKAFYYSRLFDLPAAIFTFTEDKTTLCLHGKKNFQVLVAIGSAAGIN